MSTHPNVPSNALGFINGLSTAAQQYELIQVEAAAVTTYDAAKAAHDAAKAALANCQGQSIVTIWCERGADCQLASDGSSNTNPRAHYVSDCPDDVEGAFNLNVDCPGQWWKCDGKNQCPRSSDHVVACKGAPECDDMIGPDRQSSYHQILCETRESFIGCGQKYSLCSKSKRLAHRGVDRCPKAPQECGHTYDPSSSSAYFHRSVNYPCGSHTYYACQTPLSSERSRHQYRKLPCGKHSGRACRASSRHTESLTCPKKNSKTCNYQTYYACSPHNHSYSPPTSTCAAGHPYNSNSTSAVNFHRVRRCRFSSCNQTWQWCSSQTPICSKPYRKKNGLRCWEQ